MTIIPFDETLEREALYPLSATGVETLQVNLGGLCNLACRHCHVSAGPKRIDVMERGVMKACIAVLDPEGIKGAKTLDITGGAPEMNPHYKWLVTTASAKGARVKTRTNLAILVQDGFGDLPKFWAGMEVEVIASLPCYTAENVDAQRGKGVFEKSIEALKALNFAGYGKDGSGLLLNLVYNPGGAFLPGDQYSLEVDYKKWLSLEHGVAFNNLFTITNMPIGRFMDELVEFNGYDAYMRLLADVFNPHAIERLMCRDTLSVGYDGRLYDCDFNQQLGMGLVSGEPRDIASFEMKALGQRRIITGNHCYGCTAGAGSSCTGVLVDNHKKEGLGA